MKETGQITESARKDYKRVSATFEHAATATGKAARILPWLYRGLIWTPISDPDDNKAILQEIIHEIRESKATKAHIKETGKRIATERAEKYSWW